MSRVNIIAKGVKGKEYIMKDMISTRLTKAKFEALKNINQELLGDYRFIPFEETDFSWWGRIDRKLTAKKIVSGVEFDIDFHGNVTEY